MKVLIVVHHRFDLWTPPEWFAERLGREFPGVEVHQFTDYTQTGPHLPDTDVMITWSLRPEQFAVARKLRWIHSPAAAVHALLIPEIVNSNVMVTNASPVHGAVVAEHAMALLLAMARRLPSAARFQRQHVWAQEQLWNEHPRPRELADSTLGLIGVGAIGGQVARRALAFNMRVLVVREHPERGRDFASSGSPESATVHVLGFDRLDEVLAQSDYVVLATPLTPKTRGLMNANRLAHLKSDAYLINVGRGALIDEPALVDALQRQQLGGAALDVFEQEPLPPESPLWDLPNVFITPHSAGFTEKLWERHYVLFADSLRRFIAGESLPTLVDKEKGY